MSYLSGDCFDNVHDTCLGHSRKSGAACTCECHEQGWKSGEDGQPVWNEPMGHDDDAPFIDLGGAP